MPRHLTDLAVVPATDREADVTQEAWSDPRFDYWAFDRMIDERENDFHLTVRSWAPREFIPQVVTRCQRLIAARNGESATEAFDRVLRTHRELHDLTKPLVQADYDHSRDVWQWVLRLQPDASFEVQAAALFHDIERLESEALQRIEQTSRDYRAFKDKHAGRGAEMVLSALAYLDTDRVERIAALVSGHERPSRGPEEMLLNEADALSFFAFNSPGFFDYFDEVHCRRKVEYTLQRLSERGRGVLASMHLRKDVAEMVSACGGY